MIISPLRGRGFRAFVPPARRTVFISDRLSWRRVAQHGNLSINRRMFPTLRTALVVVIWTCQRHTAPGCPWHLVRAASL